MNPAHFWKVKGLVQHTLRYSEKVEGPVKHTLRISKLLQLTQRISEFQRFSRFFIEKLSALCNVPCAFLKNVEGPVQLTLLISEFQRF